LDLRALGTRVAVEDAELIGGNRAAEEALFHLHNLILPAGRLLITARRPPRDWGLHLPDLLSRMQATAIARLDPPDDALLAAVLVKLFTDRQIAVPPTLIPYLIARMERSIAAARDLVAQLDRLALAEGRGVTRQLAAEILDSAGRE
jgi:chromosomal replication initiation ATPase DnaA